MNTVINHTERAHAILSPSSSKRWLSCTPSARMEEAENNDRSSNAALEGTVAHELAEFTLQRYLDGEYMTSIDKAYPQDSIKDSPFMCEDMIDYITEYTDLVIEDYLRANGKMYLEKRFDLSKYVPESSGSADVAIVGKEYLHVIDLKYGTGTPVAAKNNTQMLLYALGMYETLTGEEKGKIKYVKMTIAQIRLGLYLTEEISVNDLLLWARRELVPKARKAWAGEGKHVIGEWCKYCKAKAVCPEQRSEMLDAFEAIKPIENVSVDELGELMSKFDQLRGYMVAVEEYAKDKLLKGIPVKGWKMVKGRSVRKITAPEKVQEVLDGMGWDASDYMNYSLKTLTELEKQMGKRAFSVHLGEYITLKEGSPALAPASDKREALSLGINEFETLES